MLQDCLITAQRFLLANGALNADSEEYKIKALIENKKLRPHHFAPKYFIP